MVIDRHVIFVGCIHKNKYYKNVTKKRFYTLNIKLYIYLDFILF